METLKLKDVELHSLTKTHPVMSNEQYAAFKQDIKTKGQLQPVLLYRGKIVDGRHRHRALTELKVEDIKTMSLPNNLTLEEVKMRVNSTEIRRHQTSTQLAIKAYNLCKDGVSRAKAVESSGASMTNLKYVFRLETLGRTDIIKSLENGKLINVSQDSRYKKPTDSLLAIINFIKAEQAQMEVDKATKDGESMFTPEEHVSINAVKQLTSTWSEQMKKSLIASLYQSID